MMSKTDEKFSYQDVNSENIILLLKEKVDLLHKYSDHYFEENPTADAARKAVDVEKMLNNTLEFLESKKEEAEHESRAVYYHLYGRALNVKSQHSPQAEAALSKAVKLDRALVAAWNELGDCYWKKDDLKEAKACYMGALEQQKNEVSLRNLSMIVRQENSNSPEERMEKIEQGVAYAKEAVQLNTNDGVSWLILGNSYIAHYFMVQNPKTLKLCLSAYQQALKDPAAECQPNLHYNMAITLHYGEKYLETLQALSRARTLDPTWSQLLVKEDQLLKYLDSIQELVRLKGRLKGKKLQQLIQTINEKQLGPCLGDDCTSADGTPVKLRLEPLANLKQGANMEAVVLGKVVCSVHNEAGVPFTFCLLDKAETCVAVTLYNLAAGKGVIIGDSVAIPQPYLNCFRFSYKEKEYKFDSIRVEAPLKLVVNGKVLGRDKLASAWLSSSKLPK